MLLQEFSLNPIYVTKPYLPPLAEFLPLLERIWDSKVLTNAKAVVQLR